MYMKTKEYKKNDMVTFGGIKGIIVTTEAPNEEFPIQAVFPEAKKVVGFRKDGTFLDWHKEPSLIVLTPSLLTRIKLYVRNILRKVIKK